MELLLPVLLLLGLGFLFLGDDEDGQTDNQGDTAGEGGEGMDPQPPVTPQNNILNFSDDDDTVLGTDNKDVIRALGGDDVIVAGAGDDNIFAGAGDDTVAGEAGDDRIFLGDGNDTSTNADVFTNLAVSPSGQPAGGDDLIRGGAGNDKIIDILGSNTLYGDTGNDILSGRDAEFDQASSDTLFGGFGNDILRANDGDVLTGGAGVDTFDVEVRGSADAAVINDFEAGERLIIREPGGSPVSMDRISTSLDPNGEDLNVLLDDAVVTVLKGLTELPEDAFAMMGQGTGGASGEGETPETPVDPEVPVLPKTPLPPVDPETPVVPEETPLPPAPDAVLRGTNNDDVLIADQGQTSVIGGNGDDVITLRELQTDTINFTNPLQSSPDDVDLRVNAGNGDDTVVSGRGDDVLDGAGGNDLLLSDGGTDSFIGGKGDDILGGRDLFGNAPDVLRGGGGNDLLLGDQGDTLTGDDDASDPGSDTFSNVWTGPASGPVTVTDFNNILDKLELVHRPDLTINRGGFRIDLADNGEDSIVRYEGDDIFILKGVNSIFDIPRTVFTRAANI